MTASGLLKNIVSIEEWKVASKKTKKNCTLKKNCFLRLNTATYKAKRFLGTSTLDHSLFFEMPFHQDFCTPVSNYSSLLFQGL